MRVLQQFDFSVRREEPNFDRACDIAMIRALSHFGIDEDGHCIKMMSPIEDWDRSDCDIQIEFVTIKIFMSYTGRSVYYYFTAKAVKNEEI